MIVVDTPGGDLAVPAGSARMAAQAARHLNECSPHVAAIWGVNPHAPAGPVEVLGCARPPAGEPLPDPDAHAFLLAAGDPLPPVWIAVCGHHIKDVEFEILDPGMGRPCQDCQQRRTAHHLQRTGLPVRSPGAHMHRQLLRPPLTGHSRKEGNIT
ncbi:MAG: hypothetical protein ACRDS1_17925 [Pseudonocardiaceae bacterium]